MVPISVKRDSLRVGALLAEGGEGRVFELPLQPHLVFKEYRRTANRAHLEELVRWTDSGSTELLSRIRSAASWPVAVVERGGPPGASGSDDAVGVLVARAPRRFSVRHREGTTRLATLSYLTTDPAYREVAYGLSLPASFTPERLGLLYALARVLQSFESLEPRVGHGDLSAKNVLWSLQRGPEVFLIDCDNCERYGHDGRPLSVEGRRRAMTPNWDDPAVAPGANPELTSDRYSIALIFLRVVGAANFPVQARQRQGGSISIDFPVPPGYARESLFGPGSPLWELCARGLSTESPDLRPTGGDWVAALEAVLKGLDAPHIIHSVRSLQGVDFDAAAGTSQLNDLEPRGAQEGALANVPEGEFRDAPRDVTVKPVVASTRVAPPTRFMAATAPQGRLRAALPAGVVVPSGAIAGQANTKGEPESEAVLRQIIGGVSVAFKWWFGIHRSAIEGLGRPVGQRGVETIERVARCAAVDLGLGLFGLFLVAMAVAPILGL